MNSVGSTKIDPYIGLLDLYQTEEMMFKKLIKDIKSSNLMSVMGKKMTLIPILYNLPLSNWQHLVHRQNCEKKNLKKVADIF